MTFVPTVARAVNGKGGSGRFDGESETFLPVAFNGRQDPVSGSVAGTLDRDPQTQCICFSSKDYGADAGETAPTLRSCGHDGSHANAGGPPAVAFQEAQTGVREYVTAGSLRANGPGPGMAIRRLTPRECERLQGFPDDYTLVPYRGKPAADGSRYRAIGNSMAIPVMRWIGERIAMAEEAFAA